MMMKAFRFFALILVFASFVLAFNAHTGLGASALSMSVDCPKKVYIGESFVCQVHIYNSDNVSHNYLVSWIVDNLSQFNPVPDFNSSGLIQSGENLTLTPSFVFAITGDHYILLKLFQDGALIDQTNPLDPITITAVKIDSSLTYQINPNPVYPNSSFSVNLLVSNEGGEIINYTKVTINSLVPRSMNDKIQLRSASSADLGEIAPSFFKNSTFLFDVAYDTQPGIYSLRVKVEFWDNRDNNYVKVHYVPIEISSRETLDKFSILESQVENEINNLRYDLGLLQQSITVITAALLIVLFAVAAVNFWYTRRATHMRRKVASEK